MRLYRRQVCGCTPEEEGEEARVALATLQLLDRHHLTEVQAPAAMASLSYTQTSDTSPHAQALHGAASASLTLLASWLT